MATNFASSYKQKLKSWRPEPAPCVSNVALTITDDVILLN